MSQDMSSKFNMPSIDGISNLLVISCDTVINSGPSHVDPGFIVTGQTRSRLKHNARLVPWWQHHRLCWLFQQVPEFDEFLTKNPVPKDGNRKVLTPEEGSDLLGARMAERWKSGAPIDITPFKDDPALEVDPKRYIHCLASTQRRPTNWFVEQEQRLQIWG